MARQTPQMTISHPGMAAVRLRVSLRTVMINSHPLASGKAHVQGRLLRDKHPPLDQAQVTAGRGLRSLPAMATDPRCLEVRKLHFRPTSVRPWRIVSRCAARPVTEPGCSKPLPRQSATDEQPAASRTRRSAGRRRRTTVQSCLDWPWSFMPPPGIDCVQVGDRVDAVDQELYANPLIFNRLTCGDARQRWSSA